MFPSSLLDSIGRFQGIVRNWRPYAAQLLNTSTCTYKERIEAEQDDGHKQVLTYVMIARGSKLLAFKRGTFNRVEEFLRGSHCIGFGGHVTEADLTLFNQADMGLKANAARELSEEVSLPIPDRERLSCGEGLRIVGVLNDDSSAVGRRHFAFLFRFTVSEDPAWDRPSRNEKSITQLRWLRPGEDELQLRSFEYWSQLVLREYYVKTIDAQPSYIIRNKRVFRRSNLLCVLGPVGSGKSEATRILVQEFGYSEVNSGRVLAQILGMPPIPDSTRQEIQVKGQEFIMSPNGPKRLAAALWQSVKDVKDTGRPLMLVDGIRHLKTLQELSVLAEQDGLEVAKVFVHTPADIAYTFYRNRVGGDVSFSEFLRLRESAVEREVYSMIGLADAVLYNWAGKPMYQEVVRQLMAGMKQ